MLPFIIRRLLWMVVLLAIISFLTFLIFYTLPSADPAVLRAGRQPTPELVATIRENLGLDKPWYVQYGKYLERLVFHFDFGYSYQTNVSVKSQIFDRLPRRSRSRWARCSSGWPSACRSASSPRCAPGPGPTRRR
jgi:peptide/nickel transport system permease protein